MTVINHEIGRSAFEFFGDDFVELLGGFGQLHVHAEDAAAFGEHFETFVSFDTQVQVGQRLESPVDVDELMITQRPLLRGKGGEMTNEGSAGVGGYGKQENERDVKERI